MSVFYALFGVLCLGLAPLFGKTALNSVSPLTAFALRTVIAALLSITWLGYTKRYAELRRLPVSFWIIITIEAVLAAIVGDMAYFYALETGSLHEVSVVMSCSPLITIIFSYLFLNEVISKKQLLGAVLIISGLVIISLD